MNFTSAWQEQLLRQYQDKEADRIGLRLPGHEQYGFHHWPIPA